VEGELLLTARPRWRGQPGRTEVWYATLTDPGSGAGLWVHAEFVAPADPDQKPYRHGWAAVFPPDGSPIYERFGPEDGESLEGAKWFSSDGCTLGWGDIEGRTKTMLWSMRWSDVSPPLFTFPRWAWEREVLPGAQVVVAPAAAFDGSFEYEGASLELRAAPGALAHIYGHGSAQEWCWLHADLGGGDVCEVVSAVSRRPGLRLLRPLAFVQLRIGGDVWPASRIAPLRSRTRIGLPHWQVTARDADRRVTIEVTLPPERCVSIGYTDPDGATATCTNSERADARLQVERHVNGAWTVEHRWQLDGTAHAEVGTRP